MHIHQMTPYLPDNQSHQWDRAVSVIEKSAALHLIREAFVFGEFARGQAARLTGLKERTARSLLAELIAENLLISNTPKGPVRLNFSARLLPVWFPGIGPSTEKRTAE